MKKSILLLIATILGLSSFSIYSNTDLSGSERVLVKKYFVGKPGYNRRVVKVYQKDSVDNINYQIAFNAPATGLLSSNKIEKPQVSTRHRVMKFRRHP